MFVCRSYNRLYCWHAALNAKCLTFAIYRRTFKQSMKDTFGVAKMRHNLTALRLLGENGYSLKMLQNTKLL